MDSFLCGPYFKSVLSFWEKREEAKDFLLIVSYEEMQKDLGSVIRKVANFLGVDLSDDRVQPMVEHLSFDSMKKNPATILATENQVCQIRIFLRFSFLEVWIFQQI